MAAHCNISRQRLPGRLVGQPVADRLAQHRPAHPAAQSFEDAAFVLATAVGRGMDLEITVEIDIGRILPASRIELDFLVRQQTALRIAELPVPAVGALEVRSRKCQPSYGEAPWGDTDQRVCPVKVGLEPEAREHAADCKAFLARMQRDGLFSTMPLSGGRGSMDTGVDCRGRAFADCLRCDWSTRRCKMMLVVTIEEIAQHAEFVHATRCRGKRTSCPLAPPRTILRGGKKRCPGISSSGRRRLSSTWRSMALRLRRCNRSRGGAGAANTSTKRKRVSASALARRQPTRLRFVLVLAPAP
jgi:hypothetical protein